MIRVRLRYAVSGFALRLRGIVQFGVYPQGVRQSDAFRSLGRLGSFVSTEDTRTKAKARVLATVLGQSYLRAQLQANSMSRHMGTGRYRPKHIAEADLVRERLTRLSEVDDAWELTFAIARIRDLAAGVPGAGTLVRTLTDAHEIARELALSVRTSRCGSSSCG